MPGRLTGIYPMLRPSEMGRAVTPWGIPPCTNSQDKLRLEPRLQGVIVPDEPEVQQGVTGSLALEEMVVVHLL